MPLLTNKELIKQYWETMKNNIEGLSYDEFELICKSPFTFLKATIKSKAKNFLIFTHFGKFRSKEWIVKDQMKRYERGLEKGVMTQEDYDFKMLEAKRYLKEIQEYDEKNPNELTEDSQERE